jgi:NADPH:quinone reductase-like Zn-dependent oxidoreductase/SAM-dependent methyltransferase
MAAVGLSESEAQEVIDPINARATSFGLAVACINSPKSVTVSGETHLLDTLEGMGDQMFVRRLRVPLAYHSGQMQCIAGDYEASLGTLSAPDEAVRNVPMISSVTGERVAPERLREASYWALNLVSPVRFIDAISNMVAEGNLVKRLDGSHAFASVVDHILELGPHSALEVPLSDILATCKRGPSIGYTSALKRGKSATDTMLRAAGELWCMGLSPNLRAVNEPQGDNTSRSMLVNVPEYPFDRSQRYVHETRISHNYKFRQHAPSELVGVMTADSTPSEARWRHFIRLSESPWAESHVINGTILYPAAGMIVMAIEAAKQLAGRGEIDGFTLRDVRFISPMDLSAHGNGLEVQTSLTLVTSSDQEAPTFKFVIRNFNEDNRDGSINAQGIISVDLFSASEAQQWKKAKMLEKKQTMAQELASKAVDCDTPVGSARHYKFLEETGLGYGPSFQNLRQQRCNVSRKHAAAEVGMFSSTAEPHTVHPATLDAMFHLSFTALSSGGREAIATAVVTRVDRIWVSNKGLSAPETNSLNACLSLDKSTSRSQHYNGGAWACRSGKDLRLWIENLQTTSVTSVPDRVFGSLGVLVPPPAVDPKQFCMTVDTKPALDWLSTEETLSLLPKPGPEETHTSHTLPLEVLCLGAIERLLNTVDQATLDNREPWVKQYWAWAEHLFAKHREAWDDPQSALGKLRAAESWEQLSKRLSSKNGLSHGFVTVANSLPELIKGEITPLELLMVTGVLDKLYRAAGTLSPAQAQAAQYVDLLAHQKPGLNILEVGGGTASTTRLMVEALAAKPLGFGTLRCKRYTFTDVSSAFLESARDEFASYRSQMTFGTLDLDKDVLEQGYEEGTYDLVIADNVIHATLDIDSTLRNIRKLLKPGGQIMMHELLNPDGWFAGFVFGLFPGWWLGADKGRELSPLLDADGWDLALKGAGYNGADLILCDIPEGQPTRYAYVIASASSPAIETPVRRSDACVLIVNTASAEQQRLVGTLAPSLEEYFGSAPQVVNFDDAGVEAILQNPNHLAISLLEFTPLSFLLTLSETTWPRFKKLLRASRRMLWVSAGGGENPSPEHGMMDGLARTLRLENFELQLITVGLESLSLEEGAKSAQHVVQLAKATACLPPGENYEQEFLEIDGLLHTRRLTEANRAQSAIHDFLKKVVDTPLAVREAQFEIRTAPGPGHESGMYYTESAVPAEEDLGSSDVDVLVKAVSLQGLEPEAALAFGKGPVYCNYCAGVVLRAGPDTRFQEGDNVLVAQADSWRSHVRASSASVVSLPADVSFEDACATAPFMAMAHHALDEMARVRPGDTLLIQDGASPVGQAAIRLLGQLGVQDVWITVSDRDEQAWAAQHSGLPEHRILPKSSVDGTQIMSFEWKQRFDIVLSPYARDGEPLTMNCVRPGGRYIMLRSGASGTTQELQGIPSSISLSIIQHGSEPPFPSSLRKVVGTLREWNLRDGFRNATYYSAPELPAASSRIQNLHTGDAAVIAFKDTDVIEVRILIRLTSSITADVKC